MLPDEGDGRGPRRGRPADRAHRRLRRRPDRAGQHLADRRAARPVASRRSPSGSTRSSTSPRSRTAWTRRSGTSPAACRCGSGFSVITTLDEPIILVDEVLAVGDKRFREKCYKRMEEIITEGKTLFLVSHSETRPAPVLHARALPARGRADHGRADRRRARALQRRHRQTPAVTAAAARRRSCSTRGRAGGPRASPCCPTAAARPAGRRAGDAEAGAPAGPVAGPAVGALIASRRGRRRGLALVDAATLALPTTYGDVVADPRDQSAVLHDDGSGRVVAVRLDPGDAARPRRGRAARPGAAGRAARLGADASWRRARRPGAAGPRADVRATSRCTPCGAGRPGDRRWSASDGRDEAALRLRRASRADDGFLSTFLVRPLSRRLTRRAVALGLRPDADHRRLVRRSGCSRRAAYAGGGLGWLAAGSRAAAAAPWSWTASTARSPATPAPSPRWAAGWTSPPTGSRSTPSTPAWSPGRTGPATPGAWPPASLALLVVRHFVDFGFAASGVGRAARRPAGSPRSPSDLAGAGGDVGQAGGDHAGR